MPISPPEDWVLVLAPGCNVSTAAVFSHPDLTRNTPEMTIRDFLAGAGANDCEAVAKGLYPEINEAFDWLSERAEARMSGTGSCLFARFKSEDEARTILNDLPARWRGFVARSRNRSPLLDRLNEQMRG